MKLFNYLFVILFLSVITLSSCERDNIDTKTTEEVITPKKDNKIITNLIVAPTGGLNLGCVTIDYPFSLLTVNDNEVLITNDDEFEVAIFDTIDYIVDFVYPLNVTNEDGETVTVADVEELGALFASCIPDEGWSEEEFPAFLINLDNSCFEFIYPVVLAQLDGSTVSVNNETEFVDAIAGNEPLFFTFPLGLTNTDGDIEILDAEGLFAALGSCEVIGGPCDSILWGGDFFCYSFNFPVSFVLEDGSIVTANNLDELNNLFFGGDILGFSYPLSLTNNETGEVVTANNDLELNEAIESCSGIVVFGIPADLLLAGAETCYIVNFPITAEDWDGNEYVINNLAELQTAAENGHNLTGTVSINFQGADVEISSFEDLVEILSQC